MDSLSKGVRVGESWNILYFHMLYYYDYDSDVKRLKQGHNRE